MHIAPSATLDRQQMVFKLCIICMNCCYDMCAVIVIIYLFIRKSKLIFAFNTLTFVAWVLAKLFQEKSHLEIVNLWSADRLHLKWKYSSASAVQVASGWANYIWIKSYNVFVFDVFHFYIFGSK